MPVHFISLLPSVLIFFATNRAVPTGTHQQTTPPLGKLCSAKSNASVSGNFQDNLVTFLRTPVFYYDVGATGFYNATLGEEPDRVYGLLLCRVDISPESCRSCAKAATHGILGECPYSKGAIVWYEDCLVRYSAGPFFSTMEASPLTCSTKVLNEAEVTDPPPNLDGVLGDVFLSLAFEAASSSSMYAAARVNVTTRLGMYGWVECTRDLFKEDCSDCLQRAMTGVSECRKQGKPGGVFAPSCNLRYGFYRLGPEVESPAPTNTLGGGVFCRGGKRKSSAAMTRIHFIVSATLLAIVLFSCFIYFLWGKKANGRGKQKINRKAQLFYLGNMQGENQMKVKDFPLISLDILHAATKYFSDENKLGEGGFGPVYKGTLVCGMEIAVKRLSRRSSQGLHEFKNEVSLISKLQHKNLIRLFGCCTEASELLLVYEYLPNKSLDFFLFDSRRTCQLDWKQRFTIISGVARGLVYLHEDSRQTIIHRDLKASNILLDHEMNPKISDFGIARILGGNQNEANTDMVMGTLGYMAPEYAIQGQFSVKSDVFSFGVLVLEIVSGKRNHNFNPSESSYSLLNLAWNLCSDGRGLELLDPLVDPSSCVAAEVLKCIHIASLCVQEDPVARPSMSRVAVMLASDSLATLPQPTQSEFDVGLSSEEICNNLTK